MKWRPPPSTLFPYTTLFRSTAVRTAVHGLCTNCSRLPIFVNEYNAGPGWAPSNFAGSYDNAVFLAASAAQALRDNVSQLTLFNLQNTAPNFGFSLLDRAGTAGPPGVLFARVLSHLAIGSVYPAQFSGAPAGVWAVVTSNAT